MKLTTEEVVCQFDAEDIQVSVLNDTFIKRKVLNDAFIERNVISFADGYRIYSREYSHKKKPMALCTVEALFNEHLGS